MKHMVRTFEQKDLDAVMAIWLSSNMDAHAFVSADYWKGKYPLVREMIPAAEVLVLEAEGQILGFIGMNGSYIAGIFVKCEARSRGIGTELLHAAQAGKEELSLQVYKKNERAVQFYRKAGFGIEAEEEDEDTGEREYRMVWHRR